MSEWEPATDAEVAMRDALRTDDQESYFRILSDVDLLLPVSAEALQGLAPLGWGTWSTGGRTHVLAFTSSAALEACLADYNGSARRVPYAELANTWPNLEWWLAVNPGLPIEGYLPAWFVAQLSRGDLRLPTRGPGREKSPGASRIQDLHTAAMAANAAAAQMEEAAAGAASQGYPQRPAGAPPAGLPRPASAPPAAAQQPAGGPPAGFQPASGPPAGFQQPTGGSPAEFQPTGGSAAGPQQPASGSPAELQRPMSAPPAGLPRPGSAPPAGLPRPASAPPAGLGRPTSAPPAGFERPAGAPPAGFGRPTSAPPAGFQQPASAQPAASAAFAQRAMSVPPAAAAGYPQPISAAPAGSPRAAGAGPSIGGAPPGYAQAAAATQMPQFPAADEAPPPPGGSGPAPAPPPGAPEPLQIGPGGLPIRTPGAVLPSGLPSRTPSTAPTSAVPVPAPAAPSVPPAYSPPTLPAGAAAEGTGAWPTLRPGPGGDPRGPMQDPRGLMQDPRGPQDPRGLMQDPRGPLQDPSAPLPVRTPMANTPPVPEHLADRPAAEPPVDPRWSSAAAAAQAGPAPQAAPPGPSALADLPRRQPAPADGEPGGGFRQGPAAPSAAPQRPGMPDQPAPGFGSPLPRRQATPATEPAPLSSFPAFKTPAERAATAAAQAAAPAAPSRPGLTPPVIPGSPGSDRPARLGAAQQPAPLEVRGATPVPPSGFAGGPPPQPAAEPFHPANDVERDLYEAADGGSTDHFLSTLLLATVLVPVAHHSRPGSAPGESGFAFRTEDLDGERFLTVFTSKDRLAEHYAEPTRTVSVRFYDLIRNWPDPAWSFSVNPGGPIGAKYPGPQVIALASWATEAGLGADPADHDEQAEPVPAPAPANDDAQHATVMQKTLPPEHVDFYLERGYDRVAGFVHRATEVEHLRTPAELFGALGLLYSGSSHQSDAKEAYVLRWPAYRPSLYRIPYGGQNEQALKAMDGWVIERAPFRGNGFAPGEGRDVIAEFKVDSVRLPHGAQLWRIDADGSERMVAIFDNDGPQWRRVGEQ